MVATAYTAKPLPSEGMSSGLHKTELKRTSSEPKDILARNLRAVFEARGYTARSVAAAIKVSNKTVSNMLNGYGASQLDKLAAVAKFIRVPLWQLLCPAIEISQITNDALHEMFDAIASLSEVGRAALRRDIRREAALARTDQDPTQT